MEKMEDDERSLINNEEENSQDVSAPTEGQAQRMLSQNQVGLASVASAVLILLLAGLGGWLEHRDNQARDDDNVRALFLQTGRQGALNLTTIDHEQVDADVKRILDSSVDAFHDDFTQRSQPYVDLVKRDQSVSTGTIIEAGVQSMTSDSARVLVVVSVKTTTAGVAEPRINSFRMRVDVKKVGADAKVSNVEFIG